MIKIKTKRYLTAFLIALSVFMLTLCATYNVASNKKSYAATIDYSDIDYTSLTYHNISGGFNVATEDVIYKISCKNPRPYVDTSNDYLEEYVSTLSFRASTGCQIYFVDGMVCCLEDIDFGDSEWDEYADYYDILYYDSENEFMYFKFKNLTSLDADENVNGALEEVSLWVNDTTYNSNPQYVYISEIETPVTDITTEDVYFSSDVKAGTGAFYPTGYNIYSLEYMLNINQKVSHLVNGIEMSFVSGAEDFILYKSSLNDGDSFSDGSYKSYKCITLGRIDGITTDVQLQAVINYGDNKTITVMSSKTNLITVWQKLVNNNFSGHDYETYLTEANKSIIRKLVSGYNSGFYNEVKGSKAYFAAYDSNNTIQIESLIFRMPIENFDIAHFTWSTDYWQGYCYYGSLSLNSDFVISASVYKIKTNEDGTITSDVKGLSINNPLIGETEYNENAGNELVNATECFALDGYVYLRINDISMVREFFPQRANQFFEAKAVQDGSSANVLQANTASIIYDEYNEELLATIESLSAELSELRDQLDASNLLTDSQRKLINELQSTIDGLRLDFSNAKNEIAYANQQIEVMREEYEKKIDQLIQENKGEEPGADSESDEENPEEENGMRPVVLGGIFMGAFLIIALVMILIPSERRKNK